MSRYSRYPFQPGAAAGGLGPSATHQTVATTHLPPHHHHHHQHQLRNPWVSGLECRESGSTNSSSASSRRGGGGGPWLHPLDLNHQPAPARHHHLYEQPLDVLGPSSALLAPGAHGLGHVGVSSAPPPQQAHASAAAGAPGSSRAASDRDRPTTPASSPGSAGLHGGSAALDGCGGHCVAFENFCYYCLQVVFVLGVLCGVSLTIAGSVLRQGPGQGGVSHRGRDLVVLVYIGCLLALVCAVLLAVQCCVRRNVKRRKRALRERRARNQPHAAVAAASAAPPPFTDLSGDAVPLQELPPAPAPAPAAISQYQPLLVRLVQQQQQQQQQQHHHMQTLLPERHHQYRYRHSNMTADPPLDTSRSGTPWWRRRSDFKQTVIESRH
ncbi:uncharacterized protein LOC124775732 [Schistocerca piceifrons]|uniref:uncharacterized protein LOC124775732 n=1 Tax=Schistocerca piceifrons TaxID=274613 RepID=UPI001F5EC317|nr:uncharacterized protein LOC124775732 [Schistocerca piceifrons]